MSKTSFLVTGAGGQLGRALLAAGGDIVGVGHGELPVEDRAAIDACLDRHRPRFVLHCGAWTDVDGCEADPARAELVNATGTANLAAACAARDIGLVYVSTDFVFDGRATTPYVEDAAPAPLSAYGRSKWHGEQALLAHGRADFYVVRTSWVFGPGGKNFPKAILNRARSGQPLAVVTDQRGRPTYTPDLAQALLDLCASGTAGGVYHAANKGDCTWHEFAVAILAAAGLGDIPVGTMTAAALARPAARPAYSVLDTGKLDRAIGRCLPDYRSAIERYLQAEQNT
ncbi:MAG: dTDP-4-dehydrorhamnose reductase [Planctomycetes bacterium]|nr:dTDP-4-dehydrorhamnose reductase [Planctomycetota bacterium]MCB9887323.1 dTDP-4-dehydrorhamnose reductase [Planctomycetota bacterium]